MRGRRRVRFGWLPNNDTDMSTAGEIYVSLGANDYGQTMGNSFHTLPGELPNLPYVHTQGG